MEDSAQLMQAINREFVAGQLPRYAEMFRLLLLEEQPVLIHCASGKDRTGFGAALILDVLGVEEQHILEDYLLTNRYLPVDEEVQRLAQLLKDPAGKALTTSELSINYLRPPSLASGHLVARARSVHLGRDADRDH